MNLYKQYVRPHLEFSTSVWAPWTKSDKKLLEKVQMHAVNMVSGLVQQDYEGKLRELKLETLK